MSFPKTNVGGVVYDYKVSKSDERREKILAKRIDSLTPGENITLQFHGSRSLGNEPYQLSGKFIGIVGSGDVRRAKFDLDGLDFEAYRDNGRWAYGMSSEKLTLV